MALLHWWPLAVDGHDQGLNPVNVNVSIAADGKIGTGCSGSSFSFNDNNFNNKNTFTVSLWFNRGSSTIADWSDIWAIGASSASIRCEIYSSTRIWTGYSDQTFSTSSLIAPMNEWNHLAFVYNNDQKFYAVYKNGQLVTKIAFTSNILCTTYLGINPNNMAGVKYNDVRIYDEALPDEAIAEIARGKVLHLPLNNRGMGNDNLFLNSSFASQYSVTAWDTTKNGTQSANSWGGYNSGVSNPTTVYHAHLEYVDNEWVYNYNRNSSNSWLGISQTAIRGKLKNGETYTFSCDLQNVSGANYSHGGLHAYANTSATGKTFVNEFSFNEIASVSDHNWHRYSFTFTVASGIDLTRDYSWYIYGHRGIGVMRMRRPKLEVGSTATAWSLNTADAQYVAQQMNMELDVSGYGHDAQLYGGPVHSPLTIPFNTALDLYGENCVQGTYVKTGAKYFIAPCQLKVPSAISFTWWSKMNGYNRGGMLATSNQISDIITSGDNYNTTALSNWDSHYRLYNGNSFDFTTSEFLADNAWHHFAITYDGTTAKLYKDGTLKSSTSMTGTLPSFNSITAGLGTAGGVYRQIQGSFSDVRIYTTALSASDITKLYNNQI